MTENLPAETTAQKLAAQDRSAPRRVTGKLKIAIERMVWYGDKRAGAAAFADLTDHGLRSALRKPHVLGFLRSELALLREGERPRNVHRLAELREQDENRNAAVAAIKVLEELAEGPRGSSVSLNLHLPAAGYVIDISSDERPMRIVSPQTPAPAPKGPQAIDHEPINTPGSEPTDR